LSFTLVPPRPSNEASSAAPAPEASAADLTDSQGALLHALAQIAAGLASGEDPTEVLGGVLSRVAETVHADGVSLWLAESGGVRCHARVGAAPPSAPDVRSRLARSGRSDDEMLLVRLDAARQPVGALVLAPPPILSPDAHAFLSTVADILAPVLKQSAYAQRLEPEVIERTRQIDGDFFWRA